MTTTEPTTEPTTVPVPCSHCRRDVHRTPAEWQAMADANEPPRCVLCVEVQRRAARREERARQRPFTVDGVILRAIAGLTKGGEPAGEEAITVAAWKLTPDRLHLRGFPEHPDHKRVQAAVNKLVNKRGLVERTGVKLYRLTAKGRKRLAGG